MSGDASESLPKEGPKRDGPHDPKLDLQLRLQQEAKFLETCREVKVSGMLVRGQSQWDALTWGQGQWDAVKSGQVMCAEHVGYYDVGNTVAYPAMVPPAWWDLRFAVVA